MPVDTSMKPTTNRRKPSIWEEWAVFMRKWMPVPGRKYQAQIIYVRAHEVALTLYRRNETPILIKGVLVYGPEAYADLPTAKRDELE